MTRAAPRGSAEARAASAVLRLRAARRGRRRLGARRPAGRPWPGLGGGGLPGPLDPGGLGRSRGLADLLGPGDGGQAGLLGQGGGALGAGVLGLGQVGAVLERGAVASSADCADGLGADGEGRGGGLALGGGEAGRGGADDGERGGGRHERTTKSGREHVRPFVAAPRVRGGAVGVARCRPWVPVQSLRSKRKGHPAGWPTHAGDVNADGPRGGPDRRASLPWRYQTEI